MLEMPFKIGQKLTADEVFEVIRFADVDPHWEPLWKSKGYDSWEAWRRKHFQPVLSRDLDWTFVEIVSPLTEVPEWRASLTPAWYKWAYVNNLEKPPRFKDLLTNPFVQNHWYIREMANNFRGDQTVMTILRLSDGDVHIVEGMHRACAITMIAHDKKPFNCRLLAAIADWPETEPPRLGNWEN